MRQRSKRTGCALAFALVASLAAGGTASAGTNLLGDGSFEWPRLTGATVSRSYATGQKIGAWTVTAGPVYVTTAMRDDSNRPRTIGRARGIRAWRMFPSPKRPVRPLP
jgi:hypothetical protein